MHGLYRPHGADGEGRDGPSALVHPDQFMTEQLRHWLHLLGPAAGAVVTDVLKRSQLTGERSALLFVG